MSRQQLDPEQARSLLRSAAQAYGSPPDGFDRIRAGYRRRVRVRRASALGAGAVTLSALGLAVAQILPSPSAGTHVIVPVGHPTPGVSAPTAGIAPSTTAAAGTLPVAAAPECPTSDLRISIGSTGAAAGTAYIQVEFLNDGQQACSLRGYPGVSFTDAAGRQVGYPAVENSASDVTTVVVGRQQSVAAMVGIPNAGNFPPADCNAVDATDMRVYPPNQTESQLVPFTASVCTTTKGAASVTPVRPGQG